MDMKKLLNLLLLLFMPLLSGIEPELLKVLEHFKIEHDGTLETIVPATQKAWRRPPGQERWEITSNYSKEDREVVLEYYQKTGRLERVWPSKKEYQVALLCGATTGTMRKRIGFFERIVESGVQVGKVALLAGARPLSSSIEEVPEGAKTEGDAFAALWKTSQLCSQLPWRLAEHPMKGSERPVTYDTFIYWQRGEKPQSLLIVTDQPYCAYFEAVAAKAFSKEFDFEVVGEELTPLPFQRLFYSTISRVGCTPLIIRVLYLNNSVVCNYIFSYNR